MCRIITSINLSVASPLLTDAFGFNAKETITIHAVAQVSILRIIVKHLECVEYVQENMTDRIQKKELPLFYSWSSVYLHSLSQAHLCSANWIRGSYIIVTVFWMLESKLFSVINFPFFRISARTLLLFSLGISVTLYIVSYPWPVPMLSQPMIERNGAVLRPYPRWMCAWKWVWKTTIINQIQTRRTLVVRRNTIPGATTHWYVYRRFF